MPNRTILWLCVANLITYRLYKYSSQTAKTEIKIKVLHLKKFHSNRNISLSRLCLKIYLPLLIKVTDYAPHISLLCSNFTIVNSLQYFIGFTSYGASRCLADGTTCLNIYIYLSSYLSQCKYKQKIMVILSALVVRACYNVMNIARSFLFPAWRHVVEFESQSYCTFFVGSVLNFTHIQSTFILLQWCYNWCFLHPNMLKIMLA